MKKEVKDKDLGFSFIHISDIHLGRPFADLSAYCFSDKIVNLFKNATEKAFNNAINFAIEKEVDFILIAGDTFDSKEQDFNSKLILKKALNKLNNAGIKVYLICGNHDPVSSYNKKTFAYTEDSNIKIIGLNTPIYSEFDIINKTGEKEGIIHALSFEKESFNENPTKYYNSLNEENKNLFNIGLLHTELTSDKSCPYAPTLLSELKDLRYDYWALGHIHIPLINDENIIYSGTIQARNIKETGSHGLRYIRVENKQIIENSFIPTDIIRYENIDINISSASDETEAYEIITDKIKSLIQTQTIGIIYLLKINLTGCVSFYNSINENFYKTLTSEFNEEIYISDIENNLTQKTEEDILQNDDGIAGELYKVTTNPDYLEEIYNKIETKFQKVLNNCNFSKSEYEKFKENIKNISKEKCINISYSVYNSEDKVNE